MAIEACSSAHHWARKLRAMGLDARLIAAHFVSPYRMEGRSGKNDMTDAAAICEAASRPSMRFVAIKSILWAVMTRDQGFDPKHVSEKPQAKRPARERTAAAAQFAGCPA